MKPLTLNLSTMKKVAGDKKSSTFEHKLGHQIVVAHNALSPDQRKLIEKMPLCHGGKVVDKMAKGGSVLPKHMHSPKNPKLVAVGTGGVAMAEGGDIKEESASDKLKRYSGYVTDGVKDMIQNPPSVSEAVKGISEANQSPKMYAEGTDNGPVSQDDQAPQQPPVTVNVAPTAEQPVVQQAPAVAPTPVRINPLAQMNQPIGEVPVAETVPDRPLLNANGTANQPAAAALDLAANKQKRDADIAEGAMQANIQHGKNLAEIDEAQNVQNDYNGLAKHADELRDELKDINPNHYMESGGTQRKVLTAIGLFLGGLGGGIAHTGGNAALDYLNRQIDRDIDSQKANNEKRKTIWGAYKDLFGQGMIAHNMTKVAMLDAYDGQMKEVAYKLATPRAMANYTAAHAAILTKREELLKTSTANAALQRVGGTHMGIGPTPLNPGQPGASNGQPAVQSLPAGVRPQAPSSQETNRDVSGNVASQVNPVSNDSKSQPEVGTVEWYKNHKVADTGGAKSKAEKDESASGPNLSILSPDAEQKLKNLTVSERPDLFKYKDEISAQLSAARKAEVAMNNIHKLFSRLGENADKAGASGYAMRKFTNLSGVPYIGPMAEGAGNMIGDMGSHFRENRGYTADQGAVAAQIKAVFPSAGEGLIHEILGGNLPEEDDGPELRRTKEENVLDKMRANLNLDKLGMAEMLNTGGKSKHKK